MAINNILEVAKQGMTANQQALQLTSNNIANASTPGYSRQKAVFEENAMPKVGGIRMGGGVRVKESLRIHDTFLEKQILQEARGYGGAKSRGNSLTRLQDVLHSNAFQIGDIVNDFFNDVRELSANPEQVTLKTSVIQSAKNAAFSFKEIHRSVDALRSDLDAQLEVHVTQVNSLAEELAGLNMTIAKFSKASQPPHELFDRRDMIVKELSQKLGLNALTDDQDNKNLTMEGIGILVSGVNANKLVVMRTPADENGKAAGSLDVFVKEREGYRKVTDVLREGELAGLIQVRDEVVTPAIHYLDRIAYQFAKEVNQVHRQGVGSDGVGGRNLFKEPTDIHDAAHYISVDETMEKNPSALAVGYDGNAPSDNRLVLEMAAIQEKKLLPETISGALDQGGNQTLNDALNSIVGEVAIRAEHEEQVLRHQEAIMDQLHHYRESVSGVSLEEEALNMMQFQSVFNASARAMKMGAELYDSILAIAD